MVCTRSWPGAPNSVWLASSEYTSAVMLASLAQASVVHLPKDAQPARPARSTARASACRGLDLVMAILRTPSNQQEFQRKPVDAMQLIDVGDANTFVHL